MCATFFGSKHVYKHLFTAPFSKCQLNLSYFQIFPFKQMKKCKLLFGSRYFVRIFKPKPNLGWKYLKVLQLMFESYIHNNIFAINVCNILKFVLEDALQLMRFFVKKISTLYFLIFIIYFWFPKSYLHYIRKHSLNTLVELLLMWS